MPELSDMKRERAEQERKVESATFRHASAKKRERERKRSRNDGAVSIRRGFKYINFQLSRAGISVSDNRAERRAESDLSRLPEPRVNEKRASEIFDSFSSRLGDDAEHVICGNALSALIHRPIIDIGSSSREAMLLFRL